MYHINNSYTFLHNFIHRSATTSYVYWMLAQNDHYVGSVVLTGDLLDHHVDVDS